MPRGLFGRNNGLGRWRRRALLLTASLFILISSYLSTLNLYFPDEELAL
jgi:hypothetical protein